MKCTKAGCTRTRPCTAKGCPLKKGGKKMKLHSGLLIITISTTLIILKGLGTF